MLDLNINLCQSIVASVKNYWKSVYLYARKPHTVNRRLSGSKIILVLEYTGNEKFSHIINSLYDDIENFIGDNLNLSRGTLLMFFDKCGLAGNFTEINCDTLLTTIETQNNGYFVAVNKLIPKNPDIFSICFELITFDLQNQQTAFYGLEVNDAISSKINPSFCLKACIEQDRQSLLLFVSEKEPGNHKWLQYGLFPKLKNWLESVGENKNNFNVESLSLINIEEYTSKYNEMKLKYGKRMVEIWPETTDPKKYVYEDVAIATYLLILWKEERKRRKSEKLQSFADLGCGNGLLVYILTAEGHEGLGIDIRKRGIWDLYPGTTDLREQAILPSDRSLLPETDWIIGNHSDELSPWVPVIAARSSYNCRYFLLPCCAYNFNGQKYQRKSSQRSQYEDFILYAKSISDVCGFRTSIDRLKIPSTKRIAIIGDERVYEEKEEYINQRNRAIQSFIDAQYSVNAANADVWNADFVPRPNVDKVRNCTKINKSIEQEIIVIIFEKILSKKRYVPPFEKWNAGGKVLLADLAKELSKVQLQELKSEFGGLQTLLKNNSSVFLVRGGSVQLQSPIKYNDKLKEVAASRKKDNLTLNYKLKPCWFKNNHPDGCPLMDEDCSFKHK